MDTKERILEGMLELIQEKGLEKASIGTLAKKIKISPGNIYYYFSGKTEILNTLYFYCFDKMMTSAGENLYQDVEGDYTPETIRRGIQKFIKGIVVFYRENPHMLNYMVTAKSSSYLSGDIKNRMLNPVISYRDFLDKVKELGIIKNLDTDTMFLFLRTVTYEFLKQDILLHNITLDDKKIDDLVDLLLTGIFI